MFHDHLKRFREAAEFTQASFAERLGVPLRTIQNWEQGHREPGLAMLLPLARTLGVTVDELLTGERAGAPKKPGARPRKPK